MQSKLLEFNFIFRSIELGGGMQILVKKAVVQKEIRTIENYRDLVNEDGLCFSMRRKLPG